MKAIVRVTALLLTALAAAPAAAQTTSTGSGQAYPDRPIRLIVPWPAAGISDVIARGLGQQMTESLGQQIVVDNRPGAGGTLGVAAGAKATPDGYTLLMTDVSSHAISATLYSRLPYHVQKDFQPIALVSGSPMVLVANAQVGAKTVPQLIQAAKTRGGKMVFASSGNGAITHLAAERFKNRSGITVIHVPYKGSPPATASVLAGETSWAFSTIPSALPHVKSGRLVGLGVSFPKRSSQLPDVPAIAEFYPGYDLGLYTGLFAPAGMPKRIAERMHAETLKALATPKMKEVLAANSAEGGRLTMAQFRDLLAREVREWGEVIRATGVRVE
jgi:tripartite-type tricarboxylate transporter receptor subunit TctC